MTISVLHNFASLNLGGAESRVMDIYRTIDRGDFRFDFVVYDPHEQYFEEEIRRLGGKVFHIPSPRESLWGHARALLQVMRNGQYDVLHTHTSYHSGLVALLGALQRIPVRVAHARTSGSMSTLGGPGRFARGLGQFLIRRFATKCLAISDGAASYVFGERTNYTYLPNAFDLSPYLHGPSKTLAREKLGLPKNDLIIGQVGRLQPVKNQRFSIALLREILSDHSASMMVFVGSGADLPQLQSLGKDLGVYKNIKFAGLQNNIADWMAAFDLLVMPSLYEGLGTVVLEAQAAAIPVLASTGVPQNADLGLGLVHFLPLEASQSQWKVAVREALEIISPSVDDVTQAFSAHGFTLSSVVSKLEKIYSGE